VGWDKGSLTEQQTKRTVTTTILIRRIYKTNRENEQSYSHRQMPSAVLRQDCLPTAHLPPTRTQYDDTCYRISCFVWPFWVSLPGCVPSWLLVKINPVLAEPRTLCFLHTIFHQVPCLIQHQAHIFPSLLFALYAVVESFVAAFHVPCQIQLQVTSDFP